MINFFMSLMCCFTVFNSLNASVFNEYLQNRINSDNMRYFTMALSLELMEQRQAKILVETGTARYGSRYFATDGGSTIIFGEWAKNNNSLLYTVDISPLSIENSQLAVGSNNHVIFNCQDSITFLQDFNQPIDFLYLDSYDYEIGNPNPSQEHHLKEIIAAYPKLTSKSIVMIDDCDLPGGGKGGLVISYLLERGWKVLAAGYQVILVQE